MIISDEQAHLAARYLQRKRAPSAPEMSASRASGVTPELVERVRQELRDLPETRVDRVESARARLAEAPADDEIAAKMIGRIISDSLR